MMAARNELAIERWTTDLDPSVTVRDLTQKELKSHTYPRTISEHDDSEVMKQKEKNGREWLQARLTDPPDRYHNGFVIFPPSDGDDDTVMSQLTSQLDETAYQKTITPIFQSVQGRKRGRRVEVSRGDNKRRQAKMWNLAAKPIKQVGEAEVIFNRFKVESDKRESARATLEAMRPELSVLHTATMHMCDNYLRIRQVSLIRDFFFSSVDRSHRTTSTEKILNHFECRYGRQPTKSLPNWKRQRLWQLWNHFLVLEHRECT